jgi:hypothetical protein
MILFIQRAKYLPSFNQAKKIKVCDATKTLSWAKLPVQKNTDQPGFILRIIRNAIVCFIKVPD